MDSHGVRYQTNPYKWDTDGDGLSDGYEAGAWVIYNGMKYFQVRSNPMLKDTDGDWVADGQEVKMGMDPLKLDSDGDSLLDPFDPKPTESDGLDMSYNLLSVIRSMQMGAVYQEAGVEGGEFHYLVGDDVSTSRYYKMGRLMPKYVKGWVNTMYKIYLYK